MITFIQGDLSREELEQTAEAILDVDPAMLAKYSDAEVAKMIDDCLQAFHSPVRQ